MTKHSRRAAIRSSLRSRKSEAGSFLKRQLGFEDLEQRRLLSTVGLAAIPNVTLPAGTSVMVALNGSDSGNTVKFGVTSSSPNTVTPILMPSTNPSVQFDVAGYGNMTFQLFNNYTPSTVSHIEALVNAGVYNGDYIYRAETGGFPLIQGGNDPPQVNNGNPVNTVPSSITDPIDEEYNPDLNYTTAGDLAMARTGSPNTSSTEFFITDGATRSLDYSYTLFGFQTLGSSVVQALDALPTTSQGGIDYLNTPVKITSASIIASDTQNGVLMLRAPVGAIGSYTVNVTAYDGTNTPTTQSFTVTVAPDSATNNVANPWASQTPTVPTSVAFQPQSGQGTSSVTSANNSTTSKELKFLVSGTTSGDLVTVYADGAAIGSADATSSTTTITTNGTSSLLDGTHSITATQTVLDFSVNDSGDSNTSETSNVDSLMSPAIQLQVASSLTITSTAAATAKVGQPYTYTLTTNAPGGDTVTVTPGTLPTGMTFNSSNNTFSWTPTSGQANTSPSFTATLTDTAGNSTTLGPVFVDVSPTSGLTVISPPTTIAVGSPELIAFNSFDAGTPNYTVTTSNNSQLTATLMPQTNQVLTIDTNMGDMEIQLLNNYTPTTVTHFVDLVNSGVYTSGASFYRVLENFMIQGGAGSTGSTNAAVTDIPVELNADLRFTSSGLLAFANNGVDGNSSEFFLTGPDDTGSSNNNFSDGFLDFRYTIFGKLISGDNVRQAIAATTVTTNTTTSEKSQPTTPVTITGMSISTVTNAGVFLLKAANAATGSYTVTVSDGLGGSQQFMVNVGTNQYDPPNPWVNPINGTDKIFTPANTAVNFTPQGESADGETVQTAVQVFRSVPAQSGAYVDSSYSNTSPPAETTNTDITLTQNGSSYTVTPASGFYGVQYLEVTGQSATPASWDSGANVDPVYRAYVPVYVAPPAPTITSITAGGQTLSGSTFENNSSTSTELSFNISGAVTGATVSLFVDGGTTAIATGTVASGATTIVLTTDGSTKLADGSHAFTVEETIATSDATLYADWAVASGATTQSPGVQFPIDSTSLNSPASAATNLTIGLSVLVAPATTAKAGLQYTYVLNTNAPSGDTVTVTPVNLPTGMVFTAPNSFTWTPTNAQVNTSPAFTVDISDVDGNSATVGPYDITVSSGLGATQIPTSASGGDVTVLFSGSNVLVYDNIAHAVLSYTTFTSNETIEVDAPAGQANSVLVLVPSSSTASLPAQVSIQGAAGSTNNQVTIYGTAGANNFTTANGSATDNGLVTVYSTVQKVTLAGRTGNDYYTLTSSNVPTWVVDTGGSNTMDFSHDTAGVTVNLGLDKGQAQSIAPWGTSLDIYGVINELMGSAYADVLTGGPASTTTIHAGVGNDTLTGGSGNNIIIGGGGNDTITGGAGKNLLIAGTGTDSMYTAGTQNMVFGGTTNYDSNDSALLNLLQQGTFVSYGYSVRRALASAASNPALRSSLFSFTDSGAVDTVFGNYFNNMFVLGKKDVVKP